MTDKFSFKGRSCWSAWGPGEFFGFTKQGETVCALIRNENDNSIHLLDISKGDFRLDEDESDAHLPIQSITIDTENDHDIYLNVCDFKHTSGWVYIIYVDDSNDICEKQYREDVIQSIDIVYKGGYE